MLLNLNRIERIHTLSQYLGYNEIVLEKFIEDQSSRGVELFTIKRKNKERLVAQSLDDTYSNILKSINEFLQNQYKPLKNVTGYVKGKSIKDNANPHVGKKFIIKADLKDFFYSIDRHRVKKIFMKYGGNDLISECLSKLVTYDGILYPGLETSPILSNIILSEMDHDFKIFADENKLSYSRYADDITLSGNKLLGTEQESSDFYKLNISNIIKKNGFVLNINKFKFMKQGQTQVVTGLSVTDDKYPRIPRKIKIKIKTACFLRSKLTYKQYCERVSWFDSIHLEGILHFYSKVEPEFVEKMRKLKNFGRKHED